MIPFKLTQSQKRQIEKAKTEGQQRVVLKLSPTQRTIDENFVADIEDLVHAELGQDLTPSGIAKQLREAREAAGMSLADVANIAGMTRQAILAIESGKNANPKIETIRRIAQAFGLSLRMELVSPK
jgi:DNA-binding XRE family transcriptional regulator